MKIDEITLKHFLREIHLIQRGKAFHHLISRIDENQKQHINLERNLLDIFLFRIDRDPGAYAAIIKKIEDNEPIQKKTINYIKKLLCDCTCDIESFIIRTPEQTPDEEALTVVNAIRQNFSFFSHNTVSSPNVEANIEFLRILHSRAIDNSEEIEAAVIKRIIDGYKTQRCLGKTPFIDNPAFSDVQNMLKWDNLARAHIFSLLKKPELYIEDQVGGYDLGLRIFFPYSLELNNRFASHFHIEKPSLEKMVTNQDNSLSKTVDSETVCYYKFTTDAIFIAAEFWFNELDESEKISFLNSEYPVIIDERSIEAYPVQLLSRYADDLDNNGYWDEALELYNNCLKRSSHEIDRFFFSDNIGCCYRDIGNYTQALVFFKQSYDLIRKLNHSGIVQEKTKSNLRNTNRSHLFLELLSSKNVGEMLYQTGKTSESKKFYNTVQKKISKLDDKEHCDLLHDLAQSYQNINQFNHEMKVLISLSKERGISQNQQSTVLKRFKLFEKLFGTNGKLNPAYLSMIKDGERGFALMQKAQTAMNTFQNRNAIKILTRAPTISEPYYHALYYFSLGMAFFESGDYPQAKQYFTTSIDESLERHDMAAISYGYLGLCEILAGNKNESILFFEKALSIIFNSSDIEDSKKQFGLLVGIIASEATWFDQDIVSWFVEKFEKEIDEHFDNEKSTFIICSTFIRICQFSKALNHLDKLIAKTDEKSEIFPVLLYRRGTILADNCDYLEALDLFNRALKTFAIENKLTPKGPIFYGMAQANLNLSNFIEAEKCVQESYYCDPHNEEYIRLKEKLEDFNLYHISTESVKCLDARFTFKTAEKESLQLYARLTEEDEFDFSPPLGYYGKGLEMLLDAEVWSEIRKKILNEYSTDRIYGIPKNQFNNIPKFFRWALDNNEKSRKTISLGTWGNIILDIQDPDPIVNSINQKLTEKFGEKYTIIQEACKFLAPYRNDVFHKLILKKTEMEATRKTAVQHINNVISLLYGTLGTIPSIITKEVPIDILKFEEASKFFRNNEFGPALKCYEDAINHDPTNTDALVGKANVYIKTGEADKAIRCLEIALHLDPCDFDAHRVKGHWYATFEKDWHKAAQCFQKALEINPKDDMAMLNLGCAFWEIFEPAMGMKCFQKVKEINPNNPFIDEEYKNCTRALKGIKESLLKINKMIESSPDDLSLISGKGFLHYNLGEYRDAFHCFDKEVKHFPEDSESWYFRGYSLLRLGRDSEANQSFVMVNFLDKKEKTNF